MDIAGYIHGWGIREYLIVSGVLIVLWVLYKRFFLNPSTPIEFCQICGNYRDVRPCEVCEENFCPKHIPWKAHRCGVGKPKLLERDLYRTVKLDII